MIWVLCSGVVVDVCERLRAAFVRVVGDGCGGVLLLLCRCVLLLLLCFVECWCCLF